VPMFGMYLCLCELYKLPLETVDEELEALRLCLAFVVTTMLYLSTTFSIVVDEASID
jgi:hypothetical protein